MAASFPSSTKTFTQKTDNVDTVYAADINSAYDEIEAIETELGTDPAGTFDTVVLRLDDIDSNLDQDVTSGASPTFDGNNFTGIDANDVDIADAGNIITAEDVEGALQEIAGDVDDLESDVGDLDTAVGLNTTHRGLSAAVHGLPANVNVLGNRNASGQFIQHGYSSSLTTGSNAITWEGYALATISFPVTFTTILTVIVSGKMITATTLAAVLSADVDEFDAIVQSNAASTAGHYLGYIAIGT